METPPESEREDERRKEGLVLPQLTERRNMKDEAKNPLALRLFEWDGQDCLYRGRERSSHYCKEMNKEIFRTEYCMAVKRGTIEQMKKDASSAEIKLLETAKRLEEGKARFEEHLKETEKNTLEAIRIAEQATNAKMEKVAEMRKVSAQMAAVKKDISMKEELLEECLAYKDFLLKLSPLEWQEKQRTHREMAERIRATVKEDEKREMEKREMEKRKDGKTSRRMSGTRDQPHFPDVKNSRRITPQKETAVPIPEVDVNKLAEYEESQLYFREPEELLGLLPELENQIISLMENSTEAEETLREFRDNMEKTRKKMERELEQVKQQIDVLTHAITREKDTTAELQLRAKLFSYGLFKGEDKDAMLECLGKNVKELYRSFLEETRANLSTLQMLTIIESHLEEVQEKLEMVPRGQLAKTKKVLEKKRRQRLMEKSKQQEKVKQEERNKKALERSQAATKKPVDWRLKPRSLPPVRKYLTKADDGNADSELEKQLYFFS